MASPGTAVARDFWSTTYQDPCYVELNTISPSITPTDTMETDVLEDMVAQSISTKFSPNATIGSTVPDVVLTSSDAVLFYVHTNKILTVAPNFFRTLRVSTSNEDGLPIVSVTDPAAVLEVILYAIYDFPHIDGQLPIEPLIAAILRMPTYGLNPATYVVPSTSLYSVLLSHAPLYPLDIYAVAAHFHLEQLCVSVSSHLLGIPLCMITDDLAQQMGASYLRRLFLLHMSRFYTLRAILLEPPYPHPPTKTCSFIDQQKLLGSWASLCASLARNANPDLPITIIESVARPLRNGLRCELCRKALTDKLHEVIVRWSLEKRTI